MHCPACQYRFTFCDSLKVLSPYRVPCPACKTMLTLGRKANRWLVLAVLAGAAAAALGIYLDEAQVLTSSHALVAGAGLVVLTGALGEWYFWKHGVLALKERVTK